MGPSYRAARSGSTTTPAPLAPGVVQVLVLRRGVVLDLLANADPDPDPSLDPNPGQDRGLDPGRSQDPSLRIVVVAADPSLAPSRNPSPDLDPNRAIVKTNPRKPRMAPTAPRMTPRRTATLRRRTKRIKDVKLRTDGAPTKAVTEMM